MAIDSDIYQAILDDIPNAISGYVEIPEGIDTENNAALYLRQGYGLQMAESVKLQDLSCQTIILGREALVILVRQVVSTQHNAAGIVSTKKAMLDDIRAVRKRFHYTNKTLGGLSIDMEFNGDTGVDFLDEEQKYYSAGISFLVKYRDEQTT